MTRTRTLRGRLDRLGRRLLVVDDGRFTHGYRVKAFFAWPTTLGNPVDVVLCTNSTGAVAGDGGNGSQIGWVLSQSGDLDTSSALIDPDHVVVEDLFVHSNIDVPTNYVIVLELIEIPTSEAIVALIKERVQQ